MDKENKADWCKNAPYHIDWDGETGVFRDYNDGFEDREERNRQAWSEELRNSPHRWY